MVLGMLLQTRVWLHVLMLMHGMGCKLVRWMMHTMLQMLWGMLLHLLLQ